MRRTLPVVCAFLLLASGPAAFAHRMIAAARVREDGSVLLQAFFPDGTPARRVKVEVRRPDGSLFAELETDAEGKAVVKAEGAPGRWTARFVGSMGHATEAEFQVAGAKPGAPPAPAAQEDLVRREPVPWRDILAGLGFIFGLSALLMCLKLRRELRRTG